MDRTVSGMQSILIADGAPGEARRVADALRASHHGMLIATDGEACLRYADQLQPDLILLDVGMPGTDGFELCRRLKAQGTTGGIPVILMMPRFEDRGRVFDAGADDYIVKPFLPAEVSAKAALHLRMRGLERRLSSAQGASGRQSHDGLLELKDFALNRIREAAYLIDEHAHFVYVNEEACRSLGYDADELLRMKVMDIDPDWSAETWAQAWVELRAKNTRTIETRHRRRDGTVFPIEVNATHFEFDGTSYALSMVRDLTDRKRTENALRFMAQLEWRGDGSGRFLDALTRYLGDTLGVDYVIVGRLAEEPGIVETAALYAMGDIVPNIRYALAGTPCDNVVGKTLCCYRAGIQSLFPEDTLLVGMAAESYAGLPLWDAIGQPIGLLAVLDRKPLDDEAAIASLLQLVAIRAAAELEHERHERQLRAREQAFQRLAENLPDSVVRWDNQGRHVYVNPANERAIGAKRGEVAGKRLGEAFPDGRFASLEGEIDRVIANGEPALFVLQIVPGEGRERRVLDVSLVPEFDAAGCVSSVLGIGRDMTDIYRMQASLAAREQEFRSLAEHLPDNIVRYDMDGRVIYINPVLERTLGESPARLPISTFRGRGEFAESGEFSEFGEYVRAVDAVLAGGKDVEIEIVLPSNCGEPGSVHQIRIFPERGAGGEMTGALAIGRDITKRKEAERQLIILNRAMNASSEAVFLMDARGRFIYVNDAACRSLGYSREELLTMTPLDIDPDFTREELAGKLRNLFARGSATAIMESRHRARDGRVFPVEIGSAAIEHEGDKFALALVRDIAERKQAEQERLTHLRFLECMDRINRAIQGADDVEPMMTAVLDAVLETFDCDRAFLLHPCDPGASAWTVPMECCKPGYSGALEQGLVLSWDEEIAQKQRLLLDVNGPVKFGSRDGHALPRVLRDKYRVRSLMSMAVYPKMGASWEFGIQQCSRARDWTPWEERLFQEIGRRLADGLSIMLAYRHLKDSQERLRESNEQLRELTMRRETAREEERKRIAREIHDELGQNLTALRMSISQLRFQYGADYPFLAGYVADMHKLATETLQTVRNIATTLRPAVLDAGIGAALSWLANEFRRHTKIACRLDLPESEVALDEELALSLFRIVQESLTNVTRHSGATQVDIALTWRDGVHAVSVRDDGQGFDPAAVRTRSLGLAGMRERAHMAGGELDIVSAPGCGTTVTVSIPIRNT